MTLRRTPFHRGIHTSKQNAYGHFLPVILSLCEMTHISALFLRGSRRISTANLFPDSQKLRAKSARDYLSGDVCTIQNAHNVPVILG